MNNIYGDDGGANLRDSVIAFLLAVIIMGGAAFLGFVHRSHHPPDKPGPCYTPAR